MVAQSSPDWWSTRLIGDWSANRLTQKESVGGRRAHKMAEMLASPSALSFVVGVQFRLLRWSTRPQTNLRFLRKITREVSKNESFCVYKLLDTLRIGNIQHLIIFPYSISSKANSALHSLQAVWKMTHLLVLVFSLSQDFWKYIIPFCKFFEWLINNKHKQHRGKNLFAASAAWTLAAKSTAQRQRRVSI